MLAKITCWFLGHRNIFLNRLSDSASRYKCQQCGKETAYHRPTGIAVEYTEEVKEFYREFNKL